MAANRSPGASDEGLDMEPVRLGVIGCGVIGRRHIRHAAEAADIDLVAVADVDADKRRAAAAEHAVRHQHDDGESLLADADVEAVVLALPTGVRGELAVAALSAGRHVLIEKPAAMSVAELDRIIAARGDRTAGCCSSRFQFTEYAATVRQTVASGALGPLRALRVRGNAACGPPKDDPPAWRLSRAANGGGILVNWGVYDLDFLLSMTGWRVRPRRVLAQTFGLAAELAQHVAPGSDAETHAITLITCDDGVVITIDRGEYLATAGEASWQVLGERGAIRVPIVPAGEVTIELDTVDPASGVSTRVLWSGEADNAVQHRGPVRDFAAAIREGRPPRTSLEQARLIQQLTDAIYRSAETGEAIDVDP